MTDEVERIVAGGAIFLSMGSIGVENVLAIPFHGAMA